MDEAQLKTHDPGGLGHYDDYHDRHPRNGSAPCLDDALLRAPLPPSTSRERSTARLGPHPARARTLRRRPRPTSTQRISSLSRRRPTTRTFTPFYFAREEHCTTWTAPRRSPVATTTTTTHSEVLGCALYLLTTTAIPRTGPVWARGFCPGSRRPRARVPLVV